MIRKRTYRSALHAAFAETAIVDLAPVMLICLLGIFEPEVIRQMHPSVHRVFKVCQYFGYGIAVVAVPRWRRIPGISMFMLGLMLSALMTKLLIESPSVDSVPSIISEYVKQALVLSLLVYWASCEARKFFGIAALLLTMLGVANLFAEIARPSGLYMTGWTHVPCYVFGHKNMIVPAMLPGFVCIAAYERIAKGRTRGLSGGYVLLLVANAAFSHSSTAFATSVLIVLLLLIARVYKGMYFGPITVFMGETVGMVLLVFLKIQERFSDLIYMLFEKTVTFSSRTDIWARWTDLIRSSPIFGVGNLNQELLRATTGGVNAHETWLGILATGGLVCLSVYLAGAIGLSRFMRPYKSDPVVRVGMVSLAAFAVVGLMEAMDMNGSLLQSVALLEGYIAYRRFSEAQVESTVLS